MIAVLSFILSLSKKKICQISVSNEVYFAYDKTILHGL